MTALQSGLETGPLVLFDKNGNVLLLSSFNNFMAASYQYYNDSSISYGIMGDVDSVPAGYHLDTIVYYGSKGINQVSNTHI